MKYFYFLFILIISNIAYSQTEIDNTFILDDKHATTLYFEENAGRVAGPASARNFTHTFDGGEKKWQICKIEINGHYKKDISQKPSQNIKLWLDGQEIFNKNLYGKETKYIRLNLKQKTKLVLNGAIKNVNFATHGRVYINAICDDGIITNITPIDKKLLSNTANIDSLKPTNIYTFNIDKVPSNFDETYSIETTTSHSLIQTKEFVNSLSITANASAAINKIFKINLTVKNQTTWKDVVQDISSQSEKIIKARSIKETFTEPGIYELSIFDVPTQTKLPFVIDITRTVNGKETIQKIEDFYNQDTPSLEYRFIKLKPSI